VALLLLNGVCGCGASPTLATDSMDNGSDSDFSEPADMGAADVSDVSDVLESDPGALPLCSLEKMQHELCRFTPEDCTWYESCFKCVCRNPDSWSPAFFGCVDKSVVGYPPCGTWLWVLVDGGLCRQELWAPCHAVE